MPLTARLTQAGPSSPATRRSACASWTTRAPARPPRSTGRRPRHATRSSFSPTPTRSSRPGLLRAIAANFADPTVGGVSANERRDPEATASPAGLGERLYWEYDKWVKQAESRIGSIVSASGSLYAIRRELFQPITDPSATDDFAISTQVVRAGYRLVFEPQAITWEPPVAKDEIEFNRKVRIVTRGMRSVWGVRELLAPWRGGFYAVQLWSHKVVRRLVGVLAVGIMLANLSLVRRPIWRLTLSVKPRSTAWRWPAGAARDAGGHEDRGSTPPTTSASRTLQRRSACSASCASDG